METNGSSKMKILSLVIISFFMIASSYTIYTYYTYQSINVVMNKSAAVEYGSANYKIDDLVKNVEGKIVSVKKDIDTSVVGEQEIIVEVKKGNVTKDVPITVSVVDTTAPVINIKEDVITITQGDGYNFNDNVESVNDEIDGSIEYLEDVKEDSNNYYSFRCDDDIDSVGTHEVVVSAKDKYGNETSRTFTLEVVEPEPEPEPEPVVQRTQPAARNEQTYNNLAPNPSGGDLVSIAYSLIGSPYVYGTNGPYSFDCSGFVQYVYSRVGIYVSRSSSTQINDGYAVSYENAQPGDILSWGYSEGHPTHSALYVGNGMMIHAANPSTGVILSNVASWTRGSGTRVISVRRIQ